MVRRSSFKKYAILEVACHSLLASHSGYIILSMFPNSLMHNKKGIVMGVANDKSLAWGIAKTLHEAGATVALTYGGSSFEKRVRPLAEQIHAPFFLECDVTNDDAIEQSIQTIGNAWGSVDFLVHAVAYADKEDLKDDYFSVNRIRFAQALDVSCYSFTAVVKAASAYFHPGSSCLTLSYIGAEKVVPHYNVMGVAKAALEASVRYMAESLGKKGVRVNGLSAGPIRTLSAAGGIGQFRYILKWNELNAPLRRNITLHEVGGAALYLLSDLASGVTGEIHHVDAGYHIVGMKATDAPDIATVLEEGARD